MDDSGWARKWMARLDPAEFAREYLGFEADARQAEVLRSGARRLLLNCSRQWGKSTVTALMAIHRAWFHPGSLVLVTGPSERQAAEFVRKAREFVALLDVKPRGDGQNRRSILLPNGSRIVGVPSGEAKVRGFSKVSLLVIDEAARASDELYRAMRPVLAVSGGDLWLMSTPNGKRGFFWEAWTKGGAEWTRVSVTAPECSRISKEFLEEERRTHTNEWFRQEYLCEFVQDWRGLFDMDLVDAAFTDDFELITDKIG
jgi:Terminase large subunit, T4likevirus-type, N-terminal